MTDLARGAYEHLITRRLDEQLAPVAHELVDRQRLDPADADVVLSRHIAWLAHRALKAVSGDDKERLARQVAIANQIAEAIADLAPAAVEPADLVATPPDLLLRAIVDRRSALPWQSSQA